MMIVPWECEADIPISSEMLDAMERLHDAGKLAGGVRVDPTTDLATYRYLSQHGRAEVRVTGLEHGEAFVRWDGASRWTQTDPYP